jgi:NAD(P)-dependent dehydrogenase (short-subunit alcohol dehydrogenase family)
VFVSSLSGYAGTAFQSPYAATKGGLITLGRSLRAEYIDSPLRVVETVRSDTAEGIVYPGPIRPGLVLGLVAPRLAERLNERLGLGRLFRPVAETRGTLGSHCVVRARRGPGSQDQLLRS